MIKFYLHVNEQHGWEAQCKQALQSLVQNDIVSSLDELNICFNGVRVRAQPTIQPFLNNYPEMMLIVVAGKASELESETLMKIKADADAAQRDYIIGYSTLADANTVDWARGLMYIQNGYDVVLNGSFVWTTCDYVRRLAKPAMLKLTDWIYSNNARILDLQKDNND